jgi:hypothetical protein
MENEPKIIHWWDKNRDGDKYKNESKLHMDAKEHLARTLRSQGHTVYIEYPLPRQHSSNPSTFRWADQVIAGALAPDEYQAFNGAESKVPTKAGAERLLGQVSFIFDVAIEGPYGMKAAFEVRAKHAVHKEKFDYIRKVKFPMHEIEANWLIKFWPKYSPCLQLASGRILHPDNYFKWSPWLWS